MILAIKRLFVILYFAWKFRVVIWNLLCDMGGIRNNCESFSRACDSGSSGATLAKQALSNLLNLDTCASFVITTETVKDDEALKRLRGLVDGKYLFNIAWKIFMGDWNVNVNQSRWSSFVDNIKKKLPFVDKTKAVKCLASNDQTEKELSEQNEVDVAELVGIFYLFSVLAPKLKSLSI